MKRRTLLTIIVLLSLFLTAIPARAQSIRGEVKKSAQIPATSNGSLADITNTLPEIHHDAFEGFQNQFFCRADGWALDRDDPSQHLNIKIFSDGTEVAQTVADTFRQDLADGGVCAGGTCSYNVNLWGLISADVDHVITVQAQDAQTGEWVNASETPKLLKCSEVNVLPDGSHDAVEGTQNQFSCVAEGWAADPNDRSIDLNVRILADDVEVAQTVASAFRQDLNDAGVCTGGTCSFSVNLWNLISHDTNHSITVQAQDAQTAEWADLNGTPKTLNCLEPQAQTFIVNSTGDVGDVIPGNRVCETSTPGECTLRAAIMESNANPGADMINFDIPGAGSHTISPSYGFDFIFDPVTIDATTQPGFSGTPIIELEGSNAGPDAYGIVIFAGSSTVHGLVINRFALTGLDLDVNGNNIIQGNYIGTDLTGTIDLGNGVNGIAISQGSGDNMIGGTTAGAGNLISGNGDNGIVMIDAGTTGNVVQGNFIGTDVNGTTVLANEDKGVAIFTGATNNLIGGTTSQARNIISGNSNDGVVIYGEGASSNTVQGNYIGTDVSGTLALGNTIDGVMIGGGASDNLIGSTTAQARNIIAGNGQNGIGIYDAGTTRNIVQGNFIGTNITGTIKLGNGSNGIAVAGGSGSNLIGGTTAGTGNIISGNAQNGIGIWDAGSSGNIIQGNLIGTDVTGTVSLGNAGDDGVLLGAPNNTVGGTTVAARNIISGNQGQGIRIAGSDATGNVVQGNFIGTDVTGMVALGNGTDCCHSGVVLHLGASNNTIGGTAPGAGNVISGNTADGVTITDSGTNGNVVAGNFIGTDINGIAGIANASSGVSIFSGATDNLIGGTTAAARNIIAGNGGPGVNICCDGATGNLVKGNFIGTDVSGTLALGNAGDGVSIYQSADNTIGGTEAGARNLISGNQSHGIGIYDAGTTGNLVQGNYVGTDVTGMIAIGNSLDGVVICCNGASGNTVGGTAPGAGNLISGNAGSGIGIYDNTTANVVQGNLIGIDATGAGSLGNGANGIGIAGGPTNNTIGGMINGAPNTIAFNGANGVSLTGDAGTGNLISSNSIYSNGSLGIDLGENGVTLNDLFDADSGPNNLQNFPMITLAKKSWKSITIQGALLSSRNATFQIQFFSNDSCDPSGYGEGKTYLGFVTVTTNPVGLANFKVTLQTSLANGAFITATATHSANNTSEFSQCMTVKS